MNTRIKILREMLKLSQTEFAEALNLKRNSISLIEVGKRNPSDRTISDMCEKFNVSEIWLREGTGDIFIKTPSSTMEQLKKEFNLDDFSSSFVYEYLKLDVDTRNTVQEFFYNVLDGMGSGRETGSTPYEEAPKTPEELERRFPPVDPDEEKETG